MSALQIEEICLDLSHGQIRGKWWGPKDRRPILLLHGWQDNAGSFDTLIPLLSPEFSYLAIDTPGHGLSSHLPKGCFYHAVDLIPVLEEVRLKFKWSRLSLIAHSMSAIVSFFYATLYPDRVDLVCALDTLKMQHHHPQYTEKLYIWRTKYLVKLNAKFSEKPPEHTYDELVQRVQDGSMLSVNKDKAKYLIARGTRPSLTIPNKYFFTRDIRVKYMQPFFVEQIIGLEYIKQIKAAYLFIKGDDRTFSEPQKNVREAIQQLQKYNKNFELLRVRGTHHFHLNEPEQFTDKLNEFLRKYHIKEDQVKDGFGLASKL